MQISLYLNSKLAKKIDSAAKKNSKSRSLFIQEILEKTVLGNDPSSVFNDVFGIIDAKSAQELLKSIQSYKKNSARFQ